MSTRILVVDDDASLAEMIGIMLESESYTPTLCHDGAKALDAFHEVNPDLVLLDLMLPGLDGVEICRLIRSESDVPIIMLTARTDTQDVVAGLEAGADDYVTKPFKSKELLARVRTRLRRTSDNGGAEHVRAGFRRGHADGDGAVRADLREVLGAVLREDRAELAQVGELGAGERVEGRRLAGPRRAADRHDDIRVVGARVNNLKDVTVSFPLGVLTAVTGVSGSGKSSLVNSILYQVLANRLNRARGVPGRHKTVRGVEHLDKVVHVDQSPIGRTPRSNPATYTGVFDAIRKLFAETPEAKVRGYQQGRFSFNIKGGRCEACAGDGTLKIEMNFLPDVYVPCEVCHGARYNRETLEVTYKGKNIAEVLDMPIEEAADFFSAYTRISRYLDTLVDVGLGYVRLGQPATTLSGGEAQRVKLAAELQKRSNGRTIYVLDEPTTGLHFDDIRKLLHVLQSLVDKGNTVLTIEHNLDVIKSADHVIDLGPEGGSGGGTIVATGTPEEVARVAESHTGRFLAELLA